MNPVLHISLQVKFRALMITFANWSQEWSIPLPPFVELAGNRSLLDQDRQGVHLMVTLKA